MSAEIGLIDICLRASDYGVGGVGSWVLLEPHRPASPLLEFANGKYKVTRDGAEVWLRGSELIHHSGAELRAAREAKKREAALESQQAAEMELDTGDHSIGSRVFARGQGGDGEQGWFVAQVVGHRERYPPYAPTPFSRIPLAPFSPVPCTCASTGSRSSTSPLTRVARRRHSPFPFHARASCPQRTSRPRIRCRRGSSLRGEDVLVAIEQLNGE